MIRVELNFGNEPGRTARRLEYVANYGSMGRGDGADGARHPVGRAKRCNYNPILMQLSNIDAAL
jgi:hypothetical protein